MTERANPRSRGLPNEESIRYFEMQVENSNNEGAVIPVVFGTKKLDNPLLAWYGDLNIISNLIIQTGPATSNTPRGRGVAEAENLGENYSCGMHLVYCYGPVDNITSIDIGDLNIWSGTNTGTRLQVSAVLGDVSKGGIVGYVDVKTGLRSQDFSDYMLVKVKNYSDEHINYSGLLSLIAEGVTVGTEPRISKWEVTTKRIHYQSDGTAQWYDAKAEISGDMNPAHIIRELFTSIHYGLGYSSAFIDDVSFIAAADTLYAEGLGLSYNFNKKTSVETMLDEVKKTIRAVTYLDRSTGKIVLKLIRNDYNIATIPTIDDDSIVFIETISKNSNDEFPNTVTVKYWNKETLKESSVTISDTALSIMMGGRVDHEENLYGITTDENACAAASVILLDLAFPKTTLKVIVNSDSSILNPGDVFILDSPDYGYSGVIFRVESINVGSFKDRRVSITAIEEDAQPFESIFDPPPATEWVAVSSTPINCPIRLLQESPYEFLRRFMTENEVSTVNPYKSIVIYTGTKPSNDTINISVKIDDQELQGKAVPAKYGVLASSISKVDTTIVSTGEGFSGGEPIQIGAEIMYVSSTTDNLDGTFDLVVLRGCMDTVPIVHTENDNILSLAYCTTDYLEKIGSVTGKLAPKTLQGILSWDDATQDTVITLMGCGRHYRPIPPGNVRIKAQYWPASVSGTIVVSWEHRNRFSVETPVSFFDQFIESESEVTYGITVYGTSGVVYEDNAITGTSHSFELISDGDYILELYSIREGLKSFQSHFHSFAYTSTLDYIILEDDDPDPQERILEDDTPTEQIRLLE